MDFTLSDNQRDIREAVARLCTEFGPDYWLQHDTTGDFPREFHEAMARAGWLGIAMPEEYGGAGLGITEAALMMQAVSASGAGFSGASAIHMNIFGLNPVVVFGTDEQKARFLPPLIIGKEQACFAVTEPDVGLDTTHLKTKAVRDGTDYILSGRKIWISTAQIAHKMLILARTTPLEDVRKPSDGLSLFYTDLDRSKVEVREIPKMGRKAVDSNMLFIDGLSASCSAGRSGRTRGSSIPSPRAGCSSMRRSSWSTTRPASMTGASPAVPRRTPRSTSPPRPASAPARRRS
jgi:acyl-CoA dehydrogenase